LRVFRMIFFGRSEERDDDEASQPAKEASKNPVKEVSFFIVFPLALSAAISIGLGIYPNFLLELARLASP
ncbi:MAG: hypothetical protein H0W57_13835, partial [Rubrobacteraceae bacterium]|nr:hypothetical protein [Rubrobacteraceae bacterium]